MRYLFVLAHPDDEADMGGTIYTFHKRGYNIAVAIMVGKAEARNDLSDKLEEEERASMELLGVQKVYQASFPNVKTNIVPHLELVQFIESCIRDWKPDAIITHHSADLNIDHAITSSAAMVAFRLDQRRNGVSNLKMLLMGETASATEWALDSAKDKFSPNCYVEIGEDGLQIKIDAHRLYQGVMKPFPHPQSEEVYRGLAAYRGAQAGCSYAEAFECVFSII